MRWSTLNAIDAQIKKLEKATSTQCVALCVREVSGEYGHTVLSGKQFSVGGEYNKNLKAYTSEASHFVYVDIYPKQYAYVNSASRHKIYIGGMRSGKTIANILSMLVVAFSKPGAVIFSFLQNFKAHKILIKVLNFLIPGLFTHLKWDQKIVFPNDSIIYMYSYENYDSCDGDAADLVVLDEYKLCSPPHDIEMYNLAISRTQSLAGRVFICSSPETDHKLETLVNSTDGLWEVHTATQYDNIFLDPLEIEIAKAKWSTRYFLKNALGRFIADETIDYTEFDKAKHVSRVMPSLYHDVTSLMWSSDLFLRYDKRFGTQAVAANPAFKWRYFLALDIGNTMAALIGRVFCSGNSISEDNIAFQILSEYKTHKESWDTFFTQLHKHLATLDIKPSEVCVFLDPWSSSKSSPSDNLTIRDMIKKRGYTPGSFYGCFFIDAKRRPTRDQALESVQRAFKQDKIYIHPSCSELIASLHNFSSLNKTQGNISRDRYGHLTDCLKFIVNYFCPVHITFPKKFIISNTYAPAIFSNFRGN